MYCCTHKVLYNYVCVCGGGGGGSLLHPHLTELYFFHVYMYFSCGARDQTGNADECPSRQRYSDLCSIITNTSGPFQICHLHVDPAPYYYSCVYDLCLYTRANGMLCSAVEAYETACAILEIQIPEWRSGLRCGKS